MYEQNQGGVTDVLQNSNPVIYSTATVNQILELTTKAGDTTVRFDQAAPDATGNVTVASGAEVVLVSSSDTAQTVLHAPSNAPVVIFQGKGGVNVTFNDSNSTAPTTVPAGGQTPVERIVVGSAGNDKIVVADAKNTKVILGSGDSTVRAGHGVDTVEAGLGNSTIVGGDGDYTVVKLKGDASNYEVKINIGSAVITDKTTHKTTDISKIQFVQLDNGEALVFAKNIQEAQSAMLYHAAFGRDADAEGLNFWLDAVKSGVSTRSIAEDFVKSDEFQTLHKGETDLEFVQTLYKNAFDRAGDDPGMEFWTNALAHGTSKGEVLLAFALVGASNLAGIIHTEPTVIGSVTIVSNII